MPARRFGQRSSSLLLGALLPALAPAAVAQCAPQWQPGDPVPGADGDVLAVTEWDPDGAGPATPVIVLGGLFSVAGDTPAPGIATYDPATGQWGTLGASQLTPLFTGPDVRALAVLPNGHLVAGGRIGLGGAIELCVEWDGTNWTAVGAGAANGQVHALAVGPTGDLIAGGSFTSLGTFVARWNGATWTPLGSGTNGPVTSVLARPNGDILVGGSFTSAGGVPAANIARWNGTTWSPLGSGISGAGSVVLALAEGPGGQVYVGGRFTVAGGLACNHIAGWDGANWYQLGIGMFGQPFSTEVRALTVTPAGMLWAFGQFTSAGGVGARNAARWSLTGWLFSGGVDGAPYAACASSNGDVWVGGALTFAGPTLMAGLGAPVQNVARWSGGTWTALAGGTAGVVNAIASRPNGDLVVGGALRSVGGVPVQNIATRSGSQWAPLGTGVDGPVYALATLPNGDVIAAGDFSLAGGQPCNSIARWDGTGWFPLGAGTLGFIHRLAVLPNGDLIAGGQFWSIGGVVTGGVARWDGTSWWPLGTGVGGTVYAMTVLASGDLVVGLPDTGGSSGPVARWDGSTWTSLPGLVGSSVDAVVELRGGDIVVHGQGLSAGGQSDSVMRWNGATWSAVPGLTQGEASAMLAMPDGGFVLGGTFFSVVGLPGSYHIARWTTAGWQAFGGGMDVRDWVLALHEAPNGDVLVGSYIAQVDGLVASGLKTLRSPCAPGATVAAPGCNGVQLAATRLPWLGDAFAARATGLPANSVAIGAWGFASTSLPLASLLPEGQPGCDLLVAPAYLDLLLPSGGEVQTTLPLPLGAALIGQQFHHQVLPVELGAGPVVQAITASNSLLLTVGAY